jgi:hypothetical protein
MLVDPPEQSPEVSSSSRFRHSLFASADERTTAVTLNRAKGHLGEVTLCGRHRNDTKFWAEHEAPSSTSPLVRKYINIVALI